MVVGGGRLETIGHGRQGVGNGTGSKAFKDTLSAIFGQMKLGIGGNFHWHCGHEHEDCYLR